MGLSIHYSGSFNRGASLIEMIEEVKDIAEIYKWKSTIMEEHFSENLLGKVTYNGKMYGIQITPPNSETISLTFLSNGKMSSSACLQFFGNSINETDRQYLYMVSSKTQFAGSDTHKIVIHLLKYLSKKYFSDFKLIDEGEYWESGNEKLLEEKFEIYNELLDTVSLSIQNYPRKKGETFEEYFERVLNYSKKK